MVFVILGSVWAGFYYAMLMGAGDNMWEELIEMITKQDEFRSYLDKLQLSVAGYVKDDTGWDLTVINPWFVERGYEFVGYLDLFSENEPSGIFVAVEGLVWRCNTNIADNQLYWYFETEASEAISLDDMCFVHGWAHQFIWDSEDKKCYTVNIAE
jgi:hypothetical protein